MDGKCEGCGADMTIQRTHWDGCHTTHKQCAAFKAGREAGLREAASIANREEDQFINASELTDSMGDQRHYSACASGAGAVAVAILSAIDK